MKNNIEHQYLTLLRNILEDGTLKPAARKGMPGTKSLFGYQMRHDLSLGFPLLTTKKMSFKNIVVELLWFLKGDTNIKFLIDNGCNIWNEDAYSYYCKKCKEIGQSKPYFTFKEFIDNIETKNYEIDEEILGLPNYTLGDCGYQYGKVWRNWFSGKYEEEPQEDGSIHGYPITIDQIKKVLNSLKNNPESRRHIVTAVDPAHDQSLALYWCHSMFQFNCRPLTINQRLNLCHDNLKKELEENTPTSDVVRQLNNYNIPKYYLDCQVYIRSNDLFLGAPYNIASYALLVELFSKICNMLPGELVYTIGDAHIYENHIEQVKTQLERKPFDLPKLNINTEFWNTESGECGVGNINIDSFLSSLQNDNFIKCLFEDIQLSDYTSHSAIKGELSTGIKKN